MKRYFGTRIREAREAKGYTQKVLAKKLGLEGNSLARVERGESGLGWAAIELLPELLGEPAAFFFSNQAPTYRREEITPAEALEVLTKAIASQVPPKIAASTPNQEDPILTELVALWDQLDETHKRFTLRLARGKVDGSGAAEPVAKAKKA